MASKREIAKAYATAHGMDRHHHHHHSSSKEKIRQERIEAIGGSAASTNTIGKKQMTSPAEPRAEKSELMMFMESMNSVAMNLQSSAMAMMAASVNAGILPDPTKKEEIINIPPEDVKVLEAPKQNNNQPQQPKQQKIVPPKNNGNQQKKQNNNNQPKAQNPKQRPMEVAQTINTSSVGSSAASTGFNPSKFVRQEDSRQATIVPSPVKKQVPTLPQGYENMTPSQKIDWIRQMLAANPTISPVFDPNPDKSLAEKALLLKQSITFIPGLHQGDNQIDEIQINCLLTMLNSPLLRTNMNSFGTLCKATEPKLTEVEVSKYASPEEQKKFDMLFETPVKDKKKVMLIYFNSIPTYDGNIKAWTNDTLMVCVNKK